MKRILPIIIGAIILVSISATAIPLQKRIVIDPEPMNKATYTHTILAEQGTATWCGYCKYAAGALKNIYAGVWHPFYYVALVDDKCTHADARNAELGLTGFPTVFFDNNYRKVVGAGSIPSAQAAYNNSIAACAAHTVKDIDMALSVSWLGSGNMNIAITVDNNEVTSYTGHLHIYVTEIVSSLGWIDSAGFPYTFPFLDYAANQDISISGGGTYTNTISWIGANHNSGMGQNYASLQYGNIMVIASVFQSSSSGYVDETVGFRVGANTAPNTPSSPTPGDNAVDVSFNPTLHWAGGDPESDFTTYDIYFEKGDSTPDVLVSDDQYGNSYDPGTLDMEGTYYWKIVATDLYGLSTTGPIWQFTVRGNDPPNIPYNPSPYNGETGVNAQADLAWSGGDPDGDPVTYDVYFGTAIDPPLVSANHSGTMYPLGVLSYNTTYYWRIVAWDTFDEKAESAIWQFTTSDEPNVKPNDPIIDGKTNIRIRQEYDFEFSANDPNDDQVLIYVEWGDGSTSGWQGPVDSGEILILSHSWDTKGSHTIRGQAKDIYGSYSDWTTKPISVIRAKNSLLIQNRILFGLFPMVDNEVITYWHGSRQQVLTSQFDGYIGNIFMVGVLTI